MCLALPESAWPLSAHSRRWPVGRQGAESARGCVKTPTFNLRVESGSRLRQSKTNNSNEYCREKVIEKMILCIRGLCTFSHSLAPQPPFRGCTVSTSPGPFHYCGLLGDGRGCTVAIIMDFSSDATMAMLCKTPSQSRPGQIVPWDRRMGAAASG